MGECVPKENHAVVWMQQKNHASEYPRVGESGLLIELLVTSQEVREETVRQRLCVQMMGASPHSANDEE